MSSEMVQQWIRKLKPRSPKREVEWDFATENRNDELNREGHSRGLEIEDFKWKRPKHTFRFFNQIIVHIDITPSTLTIVQYQRYFKYIYPVQHHVVPVESNEPENLRQVLEEQINRFRKGNPRFWVTLQHPGIQLMDIAIPRIAEDIEIDKALSLQIKGEIPEFNDEDYFWQYHKTGILEIEGIPNLHFFITLIPKKILNEYLKYFEEVGIQPEFILPRSFVLLTGIESVVHNIKNAVVMEVGDKTTTITAYSNDRALKITELPWGFSTPTEPRGRFEIPFRDEETLGDSFLKKRIEHLKQDGAVRIPSKYLPFLFELYRFRYLIQKDHVMPDLGAILVHLQQPDAMDFIRTLQNVFRTPVLPVFPLVAPEEAPQHLYSFVFVGMPFYLKHHPHLIPQEVRWEERLKKVNVGLSAVFFIILSTLSLQYWGQQQNIHDLEREVQQLKATVVQMGKTNETLKNLLIMKNQLHLEVTALQQLLQDRTPTVPLMYVITQNIPEGLILDEMLIDNSNNSRFIEYQPFVSREKWDMGVLIKGHSALPVIAAETQVLNFISQMKGMGVFEEIVPVNRNFDVTNQRYEFQIVMIVK